MGKVMCIRDICLRVMCLFHFVVLLCIGMIFNDYALSFFLYCSLMILKIICKCLLNYIWKRQKGIFVTTMSNINAELCLFLQSGLLVAGFFVR